MYTALKNIDRADIVTSLEGPAPQPGPGSSEEGACRLIDRDSTMLSPSIINGKTHYPFFKPNLYIHQKPVTILKIKTTTLILTNMSLLEICSIIVFIFEEKLKVF